MNSWLNGMQQGQKRWLTRLLAVLLLAGITIGMGFPERAIAADATSGANIFEVHCVGCHINGGNIVRRGKTLKQGALKKNGVDSVETIAALVTNGKNNMPAYRDRLSAQEIQAVSVYVLEQATKGWK